MLSACLHISRIWTRNRKHRARREGKTRNSRHCTTNARATSLCHRKLNRQQWPHGRRQWHSPSFFVVVVIYNFNPVRALAHPKTPVSRPLANGSDVGPEFVVQLPHTPSLPFPYKKQEHTYTHTQRRTISKQKGHGRRTWRTVEKLHFHRSWLCPASSVSGRARARADGISWSDCAATSWARLRSLCPLGRGCSVDHRCGKNAMIDA